MGSFVHFPNTLRADAEALIRLMAGRATAAIRAQALEERAFFVDIAASVECGDSARPVLEGLEVRNNETNQGSGRSA